MSREITPDIVNWNLDFKFKTKETVQQFINELMKLDVPYNFEYEEEFTDRQYYTISIYDGHWATNLVTIARILEKLDYKYPYLEDD